MNDTSIKDDFKNIQADVKRKVSTAEGKKRNREIAAQHITSTRCETMRPPASPKETFRHGQVFMYCDDFYQKKGQSPGFT